jgi:hypothetical protein
MRRAEAVELGGGVGGRKEDVLERRRTFCLGSSSAFSKSTGVPR